MTMMTALIALQAVANGAATPPALLGAVGTPDAARRTASAPRAIPSVVTGVPIAPSSATAPVATPSGVGVPASAAAPRPDRAQVRAAVDAEWRRYDVHGSGRLGPLEFATWVMRANGATVAAAGVQGAPGVKPISAMNATARAFARADANHDGGVTADEMTDFLMR